MENLKINYKIRINKGNFKDKEVEISTDIEELEETDLSTLLIENDYLESWCNNSEYTILSREIYNPDVTHNKKNIKDLL